MRFILRLTCIVLAATSLSGCQTGAPEPPQPSAVLNYVGECTAASVTGMSPRSYAFAGFALVEKECDGFFDNLAALNQHAGFAHDLLIAAIPSLSAILEAAKSHARTITKLSTGLALADIVVESFARSYAYSPVIFQIRSAVKDSFLNAQASLLTPLSDDIGGPPSQYCAANYAIQRYASYCSIANIQSLVQSALINAKVTERPSSAGPQKSFRPIRSAAPSEAFRGQTRTPLPRAPNLTVTPD